MKSAGQIALTAILMIFMFGTVTYTACNKDACSGVTCDNGGSCISGTCTCQTGTSGNSCEVILRTVYANTYRGTGSTDSGVIYSNWALTFSPASDTDITRMNLQIADENNVPQLSFTVTLLSAIAFDINTKDTGAFIYSGTGTINTTTANLTLNRYTVSTGDTTTYMFLNMNRQ